MCQNLGTGRDRLILSYCFQILVEFIGSALDEIAVWFAKKRREDLFWWKRAYLAKLYWHQPIYWREEKGKDVKVLRQKSCCERGPTKQRSLPWMCHGSFWGGWSVWCKYRQAHHRSSTARSNRPRLTELHVRQLRRRGGEAQVLWVSVVVSPENVPLCSSSFSSWSSGWG